MDKPRTSKFELLLYLNYSALVFVLMVSAGCAQGFPEFNPSRETLTAPCEEWKPHKGAYCEYFPTEELAGVPSELEEAINKLTLSQLVDVALVNDPTTLQAREQAKACARESYDASLARFHCGIGDIVELRNAQTLLANARAEMVQCRTNMFTSYADLIHSIGA